MQKVMSFSLGGMFLIIAIIIGITTTQNTNKELAALIADGTLILVCLALGIIAICMGFDNLKYEKANSTTQTTTVTQANDLYHKCSTCGEYYKESHSKDECILALKNKIDNLKCS